MMASPVKGEDRTAPDAEWKRIQQKTFTRWCNQSLRSRDMEIKDLETDFEDGLKLLALLEVLSSKNVGRYNKRPKMAVQKLENVAIALKFIKSEGMKLVNIGNQDIVEGNLKLILGLVWTLILHYQISVGFGEDGGKGKKRGSAKQVLLGWVQSKIPGQDIKNFTSDWNSGIAVAALVNAVAPGLCPEHKRMSTSTPLENARLAMGRAEEWLKVPQILTPSDITNPKIDELSVMTYVSYFRDAQPKEGMPVFEVVEVELASTVKAELGGDLEDEFDAPLKALPTFKVFTDEIASIDQAQEYAERGSGEIHVVIGDQMYDLDSMVPVLAHAFLNDLINKSFNQPSSLVVPVFNVQRANLKLSPEAELLFTQSNVDIAKITCIDDIDLMALLSKGRLKISIINHNILADNQLALAPTVIEIIDHHDDKTDDLYGSNVAKTIEPVATCTSLVAEFFVSQMPQALEHNPDLVRLLLGVILLKTDNMDTEGDGTGKDQTMVDRLAGVGSIDRSKLFTELDVVRPHLSAYQLLIVDYLDGPTTKGVTLGSSIVSISWNKFMLLNDAPNALALVSSEKRLDFFIVICVKKVDGQLQQEFGIHSKNDDIRNRVTEQLLSLDSFSLAALQPPENQKHLSCFRKDREPLPRQDLFGLLTTALNPPLPSFKLFVNDIASVRAGKEMAEGKEGTVHVVMGNMACDLDSMVSALGKAYYSHLTSGALVTGVIIPMFSALRDDLSLRTDAIRLFEECGVSTANVACANDLDMHQLQQHSRLKLTLVDHSVPVQRELVPSVVEIIDHHQDDSSGVYDDSVKKRISPVGSCATLVADEFLAHKREALEQNPDLAKLLLGVILLDTDNLSPTTGLATNKDRDVVAELSNLTDANRDGLFSNLLAAKFDTSGLSAFDLLRRDYKDAPLSTTGMRAGGSTVTERSRSFLKRRDTISSLQQFITEKGIDVLLVDHVFYADPELQQRQRQIVIYCPDGKLCNKVSKYLAAEDVLGLKEISQNNPNIRLFDQANLVMSRKKVLGLINIALSQEDIPSFKSFVDDISSVQTAKRMAQSGDATIHVVLGSSACNVDSMVSSLAQSYFSHVTGKAPATGVVTTMFTVNRGDLLLRTDATKLLGECDVNTASVACSGDLDLHQLQHDGRLKLTLVDHSVPSEDQRDLVPSVVEVIDHHQDDSSGVYDDTVKKTISPVGSCATLIANEFLTHKRKALEENPDLVKLLLGVILLDTDNLSPTSGLATDKDHGVVAELANLTDADRDSLFSDLLVAKFDTSGLSAYDLVRRDYKDAPPSTRGLKAGGSTVPERASSFLDRKNASSSLKQFYTEKSIDVLFINYVFYADPERQLRRCQIMIYCPDGKLLNKVCKYLAAVDMLRLKEVSQKNPNTRLYDRNNTAVSRKKMLELTSTALSQEDLPSFKSFVDDIASVQSTKLMAQSGADIVHVVLGSPACDVDSMVSSLARAYYNQVTGKAPASGMVTTMFTASRSDLHLRTDATKLFEECGVNTASVACFDDLDLHQLQEDKRLKLTLVDHSVLGEDQQDLVPSVVEVIDHHQDDISGVYDASVEQTISPVGSCTTLIADDFLAHKREALEENPDLVKLLFGVILLDTDNLSPTAGLATDKDRGVIAELVNLTDADRDGLFSDLVSAKFDTSGLSAYDLLRRDYKDAPPSTRGFRAGGSKMPETGTSFVEREDASSSLEQFCTEKSVDVLLVSCLFYADPEHQQQQRQISIFSLDEKLLPKVSKYLTSEEVLGLTEVSQSNPHIRLFDQDNIAVSRKKVLRLISTALSQEDIPSFKSFVDDIASIQTAKVMAQSGGNTVHVVLGSSACDVDSMVSSLSRAYYNHVTGKAPASGMVTAMFAASRGDLHLRTDATKLFEECGVNMASVACSDDLDLHQLQEDRRLKLTLVDHSVPSKDKGDLVPSVVEVIDHRQDDSSAVYDASVEKTISPVGSCTTLIADDFLAHKRAALEENPDLVKLLLGTILLDTDNLSPTTGLATDKDHNVVAELVHLTDADCDGLFSDLLVAKFDTSGLSAYDLVRRDYKDAPPSTRGLKAGGSAVPERASSFLDREDASSSLKQFYTEKSVDMLLINYVFYADPERQLRRCQILIYCPNGKLLNKVCKYLAAADMLRLQEVSQSGPNIRLFDQDNTAVSRKKMLGLISTALSQEDLPSFKSFVDDIASVQSIKEVSQSGNDTIHIVLGSLACDVDSMVSSLARAYYNQVAGKAPASVVVCTMFDATRGDLHLRTDAIKLFEECTVNTASVACSNDLDLHQLQQEGRLKLTLVDHSVPSEDKRDLVPSVVEVVDHHQDDSSGVYEDTVKKTIAPVGSCATLIADDFLTYRQEALEDNPDLVKLLLGVILLDTDNLSPTSGLATDKDHGVVAELANLTDADRDSLFSDLVAAKFDTSGLSAYDLVRRDYKDAPPSTRDLRAGGSTVPESATNFLDREDTSSSLQQFYTEKNVDVLLVNFVFYADPERQQCQRQIVIYSVDEKVLSKVFKYLTSDDVLGLKEVSQSNRHIRLCDQGNTAVSRKKILGLISIALSQEDIPSFKSFVDDSASVQTAKEMAQSGDNTVHVVMGSSACDVDSMVSSLARAYYNLVTGKAPASDMVTTMFTVSRGDLPLRTDAAKLFEECDVNSASVLCAGDLDLHQLQQDGRLKLTLVDHSVPSEDERDLVPSVVEVIDHHQDDSSGVYDASVEKTISPVGSCTTLIADDFLTHKREALEENPDLAKLLLGVILLDTDNLSPTTGLASDKDRDVVAELANLTDADRDGLFSDLLAAKFDTSSLSTYDLLRRDYKDAPPSTKGLRAGDSTVPESGMRFLEREDAISALQQFYTEKSVDVLLVNGVLYADPERQQSQQQIVMYCPDGKLLNKVSKYMAAEDVLGLKEVSQTDPNIRLFDQENTAVPREEVLGLMSSALSQEDLPSFKSFVDDIASVQTAKVMSESGSDTVYVVLASSACDVDSMVSSLARAYYNQVTGSAPATHVVTTVFSALRGDLHLRTDATKLFEECDVNTASVACSGDLDLHQLQQEGRLKLTLVDHSVPSEDKRDLVSSVVEIVDHHQDDSSGVYEDTVKKTISPVGSCATLIADDFLTYKQEALEENPDLVKLLLGVILLDTDNLSPTTGLATDKDCDVVVELSNLTDADRDGLFNDLLTAKFDTSGLSTYDLLRRDYKDAPSSTRDLKAGGSTVPERATSFLDREDASSSLQQFHAEKNVDVLLVNCVFYTDPERKQHQRQIVIYCLDSKLLNKVSKYLVAEDVLRLREVSQSDPNIRLFDQDNTSVSRKKVLGLISAALSEEDLPSFKSFVDEIASVQTAKVIAQSGDDTVHVVMGSAACDVDSMVSSLARAYYNQVTGKAPDTGVVTMMFDASRGDLHLRTEATKLFEECNVNTASVACSDDLDLHQLQQDGRLKLTLVDHSIPSEDKKVLVPSVVEIIDHHQDDSSGVYDTEVEKTITPVGSCVTLVADDFLTHKREALEENPDLAKLLLGVVLLDTDNLNPTTGLTTDKDHDVVAELAKLTDADRDGLFSDLLTAKFDTSGLSAYDLLRRDYKDAPLSTRDLRAGGSTVPEGATSFLDREDASSALQQFHTEKSIDVLLVSFVFFADPEHEQCQRQIAIYSLDEKLLYKVSKCLATDDVLRLSDFSQIDPNTRLFDQDNTTVSRKKMLALISTALSQEDLPSFKTFVDDIASVQTAKVMAQTGGDTVHIVLGSSACDVDSMVSSLARAYYNYVTNKAPDTGVVTAMFNVTRGDLHLRTDATKLFEECDVNTASVMCADDLDLHQLQQDSQLKLTLVDHSVPSEDQRDLVPSVVEVVDHHQDDSSGEYGASVEKTITPVGSCSTLIADDFLTHKREVLEENPDLAKLLLGVVLLDTDNLSPTTGLATDKDHDVVAELSKLTDADRDGLFSDLLAAKFDTSGLSSYDLLRRDYKDAPPSTRGLRGGGSTVPESGTNFLEQEDASSSLQQFYTEKSVDVLLVNYVFYTDPERQQRQRQILIYCLDRKLLHKVAKHLIVEGILELKEVLQSDPNIKLFEQANTSVSRRKVLHLISTALSLEDLPSFKSFVDDIGSVQTATVMSQNGDNTVHVVLASSACDVDSMVSSISRAYYNHVTGKTPTSGVVTTMFSASRGDLHLRTEATKLFEECNVNTASVACFGDLDLHQLQQDDQLQLTLVDHSVLSEDQRDLVPSVVEVIDHRQDDSSGVYDASVEKTISPVGSCATLIADDFLTQKHEALEENPDLVKLLLGVILLDTDNLSSATGLATDKDREVVTELTSLTDADCNGLFSDLCTAKFDTSSLSAYDLLRRDYKDAPPSTKGLSAGGSTVPESGMTFLEREDTSSSLQQFYTEKHVDVLLVNYVFYADPERQWCQRQVAIYSLDEKLLHKVSKYLASDNMLRLKEVSQSSPHIRLFDQNNTAVSRKKTLGLISTALSQEEVPSFKSFVDDIASLQTVRVMAQSGDDTIHVVLGSSSCDVDSMVSSLARAYYNQVTGKDPSSGVVIPMFSASRGDLHLRTDAIKLFEECDVKTASVACSDDLDLHQLQQESRLKLTLVDHSVPNEDQRDLVLSVVEVIDHRQDDSSGMYDASVEKSISSVGSCATLIADDFLTHKRRALEDNPDLVKLLLGVILLDTDNLSAMTGLATDKDHDVVAELANLTDADPDGLFHGLLAAKFDLSGLSAYDLLRRNYKDVPPSTRGLRAGGSTVPERAASFLDRKDAIFSLQQFYTEKSVDVLLVIYAFYTDPERQQCQRQIVIYCLDEKLFHKVAKYLVAAGILELSEVPQNNPSIRQFDQGNTAVSRRKVLHLISSALSQEDIPSFKSFIDEIASVQTASEISQSGENTVHVVLGSSACDVDSMVSSLSRAYYNHVTGKAPESGIVIPMFSASRGDLPLRTDATKLFEECNVNTASVVCSDDLDLHQLCKDGQLKLTLVDHSVPSEDQRDLVPSVIEIVDHHQDDSSGVYGTSVEKSISPVGSCVTLIADDFLTYKREALEQNPDLVKLLLGVILLDTDNLSATTGLATDKDHDVVAELANLTDADPDGLFHGLLAAKFDLSGLSAYDLLRRNYKDAPPSTRGLRAGGSTVPDRAASFLDRKDAVSSLQQFYTEKNVDVLLVIHVFYTDPERQQCQRQIVVYCLDEKLLHKIAKYLVAEVILELKEVLQSNPSIRLFDQGNTAVSRRKVLHLISTAQSQEDIPSFKSFVDEIASVQTAREISQSGDNTVHVVLGSSACDVDSMVSSLSRAYYNHVTGKALESGVVIPMFSTSRGDLPLRTDATKLFEECNVNTASVVCSDDLDLHQLCKDGQLKLTLVDHSVPSEDQRDLVPSVIEIVDHHQDDSSGVYGTSVEKSISPVGSCVTLIADDFLTYKREALEQNPDLVKLLLGVILLDTDNLSATTGLGTDKDHDVVAELSNLIDEDCDGIFSDLLTAKFDMSGLSAYDLLRRDYKDAPLSTKGLRAGGSTVPESGMKFLEREGASSSLQQFYTEKSVDVLLVNYVFYADPEHQQRQRQIVLYCLDGKLLIKVSKYLAAENMLGLKKVSQSNPNIQLFDQNNITVSRKKMLSLISTAVSQEDLPSFKSFVDEIAPIQTAEMMAQSGDGTIHVVLGSSTCDVDSMVSSLARAYYTHVIGKAPASGMITTMFSASRGDLPLRTDAVKLFEECDVCTASVLCAGDLDLYQLQQDGRLKLTLVDHSVPSKDKDERDLVPSVVEIIDHHKDDSSGVYDDIVKKTIAPVGSCATLVADDFLTYKQEALEQNSDLVKLLLGVILIDTDNLNPTTGLATGKDRDVVAELSNLTDADCDVLFSNLSAAKFDTSGLSAYDLLRRDYKDAPPSTKEWRAGGSTVPENATTFLARADAKAALHQIVSEKNMDIYVIICIYYLDSARQLPQRQAVIYSPRSRLLTKVVRCLVAEEMLGWKGISQDDPTVAVFYQGNTAVSRKQVLVLTSAALSRPDEEDIPSFKFFIDQMASVDAAKELVQKGEGNLNVVIGDQHCDLDSMVSALARSYFNYLVGRAPSGLVCPVFNAPRTDIPFRADAMHLFEICNVNPDHVACIGEIDFNGLQSDGRLRLTLVDHNVPRESQRSLIPAVVEIVDHHDDSSGSLYSPDVAKRLHSVGSCATLTAADFLDQKPIALEKNLDLVRLLLGAILLDTENLTTAAGLATDKDWEVVDALVGLTDIDRDSLYRQLRAAGYENAYNILKGNYKDAPVTRSDARAGGSTVMMSLETFLGQKYAKEAVEEFAAEKDVDVFVVEFVFYSDPEKKQRRRQLVIYSENHQLRSQVVDFLNSQPSLGLMSLPLDDPRMSGFEQDDSVSRKQVLKLISVALMPTFKYFVDEHSSVEAARSRAKFQGGKIHIVLGNQSSDLDSLASALARAYFTNLVNPSHGLAVPMFNVNREDIPLRTEATWLLRDCDVNTVSVTCLGDLDLKELQSANRLAVTLVDHNVPAIDQWELIPSTVEIIDHHKDDTGDLYKRDVTKKIEPVGSCATLVAMDFLDQHPLVLERNHDLVKLLLGVILVDTVNLEPSAGRTTDMDLDVVKQLRKIIGIDQDRLYTQLQYAKFDITGLSAYDLLCKDFKNAAPTASGVKAGASSIPESFGDFLQRTDSSDALGLFTKEHGLDLLLLVSVSFSDPEHRHMKRQCGVYSENETLRLTVFNYMKIEESLNLTAITTSNPNLSAFDQGDTTASRKHLLPLLNAALSQYPEPVKGASLETVKIQRSVESAVPFSLPVEHEGPAAVEASAGGEPVPELTAAEEREESRHWKTVTVAGIERVVDMEAIEPYKKVLSHGGYGGQEERYAVIVFAACHLPDKSIPNYAYILDNLFYYCLGVLETQAADHFMVVYLHGGTPNRNVPKFRWMRRCYPMLDRRIKKNMKQLVIVHAGFWIRAVIRLMRPFISTKFYRKVQFVPTLESLGQFVDLEQIAFPQPVLDWDERITKGKKLTRSESAERLTTDPVARDVSESIPEDPEAVAADSAEASDED